MPQRRFTEEELVEMTEAEELGGANLSDDSVSEREVTSLTRRAVRSCMSSLILLIRLLRAIVAGRKPDRSEGKAYLLTAEEVGERAKLSAKTIHREARSDRLASVRVGRRRLFREEDVDKW